MYVCVKVLMSENVWCMSEYVRICVVSVCMSEYVLMGECTCVGVWVNEWKDVWVSVWVHELDGGFLFLWGTKQESWKKAEQEHVTTLWNRSKTSVGAKPMSPTAAPTMQSSIHNPCMSLLSRFLHLCVLLILLCD